MATTTPFAYNPSLSPISGTVQVGTLAVGITEQDYSVDPGGVDFWMGPDEDLGYVIAQPVSGDTQPTPISGVTASVGFFRSTGLTESSFIQVSNVVGSQIFTGGTQAKTWLNANGYWTSYTGIVNGSVQFTSTPSQYLSIPNSTAFTQNQAFTIETWFYPTSNTGGYVWAMLQPDFLTVKYSGNKFIIDMSYVGNPPGYFTLSTTYAINNWYHIALTWTGTAGKLFINGEVEWTFTGAGGLVNAGNPLLIGQYQSQGQPTPLGYISNFRVVKGTPFYTSPFTPPTSPLTAILGTQLLLNTYNGANFLQDSSINNFTITNNGSVTSSTFNPF